MKTKIIRTTYSNLYRTYNHSPYWSNNCLYYILDGQTKHTRSEPDWTQSKPVQHLLDLQDSPASAHFGLNLGGLTQIPGLTICKCFFSACISGLKCLHSKPGAHVPASYVGGQKQTPQSCPSCFKPGPGVTGLTQIPGLSICKCFFSACISGLKCLHSKPGAHVPASCVGGEKQTPQSCPSCLKRGPGVGCEVVKSQQIFFPGLVLHIASGLAQQNRLSFFAQLSQSLTAPKHKEAESIAVVANTKAWTAIIFNGKMRI